MKIDCMEGWFLGLGDVCCFAWLGAGAQRANRPLEFFATGWRAELLRLFSLRVTDDPEGAVMLTQGYETAMQAGSPLNYLQWIADQAGVDFEPARPIPNIDPMDRHLGGKAAHRVLLFPQGIWTPRVWPVNYWLELCHLLKSAGIDFGVCLKNPDGRFGAFPVSVDLPLPQVAAAMRGAALVIGNDSGPAHLAGTLGTPVLSLHGPTTERIFDHLPEVHPLRKKALTCAGCHCLAPFRDSCNAGCHELYRLWPEEVFERAMELLGERRPAATPAKKKGGRK